MLNEIKEFEEYTASIDDVDICRLHKRVFLKDDFGGVSRGMLIVARHELEKRDYYNCTDNSRQIINEVIDCLKEWTGFEEKSDYKTSYPMWLKQYYETQILKPCEDDENNKKLRSWEEIAKYRGSRFERSIFGDVTTANSLNEIRYEKIIAEAIYYSNLNRYYLVCKENAVDSLTKNGDSLNDKTKDKTLKVIAAYLVKMKYTGNTANVINYADLANWMQYPSVVTEGLLSEKCCFKNIMYNNEVLFSGSKVAGSKSKIIVNQNYLSDFDFKIVSESNIEDIEKGYVFWADFGAGKLLEMNKQYE